MNGSTSTSRAESLGIRRAEEELAKQPPPLDPYFYAPDGTPWCRYSVGTTECINGRDCLNPRHNIPTCKRCRWQWDLTGAPPNACRRCRCPSCGWQWPGDDRSFPCGKCKANLYLEPADLKDPWNFNVTIKRDNWGRYVLPHPLTGKETHFTRVTTAAGALDDTYGLMDWRCRQVAYGLGQRPDLVNLAMSADNADDRETLNDVVKQAEGAAAAAKGANIGTTLHKLTQRIDQGLRVQIPETLRDRVTRYKTAVAQHQVKFHPDFIERVLCLPDLGLCGTIDRGAAWPHSSLLVTYDLKTGSLDYIKVKTAQQLAAYANATHYWDEKTETWHEMPPFNKEVGLVMWLPDGDQEPKLYRVNLKEGWRLLNQSMEVRSLRSGKGKHLFTEITADAVPTDSANREEELRQRVRALMLVPAAKQAMLGLWPREMPTLSEGGLTDAQLDLVEGWCTQVERDNGLN